LLKVSALLVLYLSTYYGTAGASPLQILRLDRHSILSMLRLGQLFISVGIPSWLDAGTESDAAGVLGTSTHAHSVTFGLVLSFCGYF
jgi:hypothetical protein